jgi:hypothetical protein
MKLRPLRCLLVAALLPTALAAAQSSTKPLASFDGAHSGIDEQTYERITAAKEFQDLYMKHLGEDPEKFDAFYNPHGVPIIDFERCMVVAVFRGMKVNSAGVEVKSVTEDADRIVLRFADRSFQTRGEDSSGGGGSRSVTPYGMFVLPRSDKEIVLEREIRNAMRRPSKWKEVARIPALKSPGPTTAPVDR